MWQGAKQAVWRGAAKAPREGKVWLRNECMLDWISGKHAFLQSTRQGEKRCETGRWRRSSRAPHSGQHVGQGEEIPGGP